MKRYWILFIALVMPGLTGPRILAQEAPILRAYVPNNGSNTVSVVDLLSNTVISTISVGINPRPGVITPDNTKLYVPNSTSGTVSVIDTATNSVVDTINVGAGAMTAAITPDGTRVYVTSYYTKSVSVIDTATDSIVNTINMGTLGPNPIAITPDGSRAYVGCDSHVAVIDTASNTVVSVIYGVGLNLLWVAVSPDGATVYVSATYSNYVAVIDTATNTVVKNIPTELYPTGLAFTPDGKHLYISNSAHDTVSVIDASTNLMVDEFSVGSGPTGISFSQDGLRVYVTNGGSTKVQIFDTGTHLLMGQISVGVYPVAFIMAHELYSDVLQFTDGFEAAKLSPFWTIYYQNYGSIALTNAVKHDGTQSLRFASAPGGQRWLKIGHEFPTLQKGYYSVWFYDSAPGAETLYSFLEVNNSALPYPNNRYMVGVQDWQPDYYTWDGFTFRDQVTNVKRTEGWHKFEIATESSSVRIFIDGIQVANVLGDFSFDSVYLETFGPFWRPDATFYFDDFEFSLCRFSDDFEAASLDAFWIKYYQNYGSIALTNAVKHGGLQSLRFASSPGGQRWLRIGHQFPSALKGTYSVWFYDSAPGAETLYSFLEISNSALPYPSNRFMVGVQDWQPGYYTWDGFTFRDQVTSIPRTEGWHKFEIAVDRSAVRVLIDGIQVANVRGDFTFDTVYLETFGPYWRPDATFYYDDFVFARNFSSVSGTPSISVTAPNTSVNWGTGSTQQIKWNHNLGSDSFVKIEISRDGGSTWGTIAAAVENTGATSGRYSWTVSGPATTQARIRVSWTGGGASDTSNVNFTIAAPFLTVSAPNSSTVKWGIGSQQPVNWTTNMGPTDNVRLLLSMDGGVSFPVILAASTPNDKSEIVTVPNNPTTVARVRVEWIANPTIGDASNANFTIALPYITLIKPNGGEKWATGSTQTVTWKSNLGSKEYVSIDLSTDGGGTWSPVAKAPGAVELSEEVGLISSTPSDGSQSLLVPIVSSGTCRMRVTWLDDPAVNDISNANFTVGPAFLTLTAPNGGENWPIGLSRTITWNSNIGGNARLELSTNGGTSWSTVVSSTPNDGSYALKLPDTPTIQARIRISSLAAGFTSYTDASNANFTIAAPFVTVTGPNGGESWTIGITKTIAWTSNAGGNVKIELSRDGGTVWSTLVSSTLNDGSYNWKVAGPASVDCRIRITSMSAPAATDTSNTNFTISN